MCLHFLAVTEVSILKNFCVTRTVLVVKMRQWLGNRYYFISSYCNILLDLNTSGVNLLQGTCWNMAIQKKYPFNGYLNFCSVMQFVSTFDGTSVIETIINNQFTLLYMPRNMKEKVLKLYLFFNLPNLPITFLLAI